MLTNTPVIDYKYVDYITKRRLQAMMWVSRYGKYDSTTPYIASAQLNRVELCEREAV